MVQAATRTTLNGMKNNSVSEERKGHRLEVRDWAKIQRKTQSKDRKILHEGMVGFQSLW
jgi:hypothetical protein